MFRDPPRIFGHIPGYKSGYHFKDRQALMDSGVHVPPQSGIYGDSSPGGGAFSVCLASGKYEDDVDYGNKITYKQIAHQSFDKHENKALYISYKTKKPVRVTRSENKYNQWAPSSGYEYDGLYVVDSATMKRGKAGFRMCFFELRRLENNDA
ncbi:PUA-like domain-containing protein [Boletus edulis BED1]|uniref:PUA-like domain-containing protein n=1 Tax=Boletus edulis BED1 TaxID=1328754 RepID=A0AAD4GH41_BOLED|nr:PUA-like domain-containing protein [Boletus edulis BED1]